MEGFKKVLKFILIFLLSIVQTACGAAFLSTILNPPLKQGQWGWESPKPMNPLEVPLFWMALVVIILASFAVVRLRVGSDATVSVPVFVALESVISPLAAVRTLVGIVLCIGYRELPEPNFADDANEPLLCYLFYVSGSYAVCDTPGKALFSQFFGVLPITAALSGCAWYIIAMLVGWKKSSVLLYIFLGIGVVVFAVLLAYTKSDTIVTSYQTWVTKFEHSPTGTTTLRYGGNYAKYQGNGWYKVDQWLTTITSEKTPGLIIRTIANIIFSPVFVFSQAVGVIASFVGLFTYHVQSWLGPVDYSRVPGGRWQWLLGYLFSFTVG